MAVGICEICLQVEQRKEENSTIKSIGTRVDLSIIMITNNNGDFIKHWRTRVGMNC